MPRLHFVGDYEFVVYKHLIACVIPLQIILFHWTVYDEGEIQLLVNILLVMTFERFGGS